MTARNVAKNMARGLSSDEITGVDDSVFEAQASTAQDTESAVLGNNFTRQVFSSLPTRWQEVLWYREVEGLQVKQLCTYLGMSENSASVLLKRAREGFKQAWIAANLDPTSNLTPECKWVVEKLPQFARGKSSARTQHKLAAHFETCARCAILSSESERLHERLAMVLLPVLFGGASFTGYAAWLQSETAATAAVAAVQSGVQTTPAGIGGTGVIKAAVVPLALLSAGALTASIALSSPLPPAAPSRPIENVASSPRPSAQNTEQGEDEEHPEEAKQTSTSEESANDTRTNEEAPPATDEKQTPPDDEDDSDQHTDTPPPDTPPIEPDTLGATPADGVEVGVYPRLVGVGAPHATIYLSMANQNGQTSEQQVTADGQGRWVYTPNQLMGVVTVTGYQEYSLSGETHTDDVVHLGTYEIGYGLAIEVVATAQQQTTIRVSGLSAPTKNQVVNVESTTKGSLIRNTPETAPGEVVITVPYSRSVLGDLRYWQGNTSEGPRRTWWHTLHE